MGRRMIRPGRAVFAVSLAAALGVGMSGVLGVAAHADPSPQGTCAQVTDGGTATCALYASGTDPSDTRADGTVSLRGTTLTITTADNGQGNTTAGAAPTESEACLYPGGANREPRLLDVAKCSDAGGTLVQWTGSSTTVDTSTLGSLGNDFFVWVEAHPDSNNSHGTPYHNQFEVILAGSALPVGTAIGGVAAALMLGLVLVWRLRRRPSTQK